jgi:hypothetical protein
MRVSEDIADWLRCPLLFVCDGWGDKSGRSSSANLTRPDSKSMHHVAAVCSGIRQPVVPVRISLGTFFISFSYSMVIQRTSPKASALRRPTPGQFDMCTQLWGLIGQPQRLRATEKLQRNVSVANQRHQSLGSTTDVPDFFERLR